MFFTAAALRAFFLAPLACFLLLTLSAPTVLAQEDDILILEEDAASTEQTTLSLLLDYWDRYFFGNVGGFYGYATATSRYLFAARLGMDYPFRLSDWVQTRIDMEGRVRVEMGYSTRRVEIDQTLDCDDLDLMDDRTCNEVDGMIDGRPADREISVSTSEFELREAYGELEPLPNLIVAVGRQRPIWGQFDVFSAVNLLLPIEFQSTEFGIGKQTYRMPQDVVSVTWFPLPRMEVQGYYFITHNLDPLYLEAIENPNAGTEDFFVEDDFVNGDGTRLSLNDNGRGRFPYILDRSCENTTNNELKRCQVGRPFEDPLDEDGFAFRALYYGTYATVGFTYFNGLNSFSFNDLPTIHRVGSADSPIAYSVLNRGAVASGQAYGGEIAVPVGKWTLKGEVTWIESEEDASGVSTSQVSDFLPTMAQCQSAMGDPNQLLTVQQCERGAARVAYYNHLGGRAYVPTRVLWVMAGFDADYDRWSFGGALIITDTAATGRGKTAERLRKIAFPDSDSDSDIDQMQIFGNGYVSYAFGQQKDHIVGAAGGILGPIFGATLFYNGSWRDDLDWTLALEYQQVVSDTFLSDNNEEEMGGGGMASVIETRYELDGGFAFGGRAGLVWRF